MSAVQWSAGIGARRFGKKNEEDTVVTKRLDRRDGAPLFLTEPHLHAALVTGGIGRLVVLPEYLDLNEWLAANSTWTSACVRRPPSRVQHPGALTAPRRRFPGRIPRTAYDFFHNINMIYGTVADYCSPRDCPIMSAGDGCVRCPRHRVLSGPRCLADGREGRAAPWRPRAFPPRKLTGAATRLWQGGGAVAPHRVEYLWTNQDQKASRIPAPQYIDYVMTWIQSQLADEAVFPSRARTPRVDPPDRCALGPTHPRALTRRARACCPARSLFGQARRRVSQKLWRDGQGHF